MTIPAGTVLHGSYDPLVVTLSVVIAVAASYASLDLGDRVTASKGRWFAVWLVGGSLAMGVGIWSMHFTGLLGFRLPIPVSHDLPSALLSYIVAALAALLALWVVSRKKMSGVRAMGSGVLMGGGIAGLHYMDMAGMRMAAECRFDPLLVALSVAFAITFSCVALRLTFHFRNTTKFVLRKIGSALVMGAAICAMHYTGMAAATFTASEVEPDLSHSVAISTLGTIGIITVTLLVLGFAILSSSVDRHFHTQRVELALARARMEFAYVARTASLGELAASIAHEINQPLGAVVNSASATERWLAMQPPNIAEARDAAAHVVREANRASEVIRRIRALLKKEKPVVEPLDLNEIIGEVLRMTGDEITAADVSVQADLSESNPHALGDRVQIKQVLINLISNAVEAMGQGKDGPRQLRIQSAGDSDVVQISVQDSGIGLDAEHLDRMFHSLFTTKEEGIGMGLSISRSIIEAHGGQLWAEPLPDGAVFHFRLPRAGGKQ